MKGFPSAAVRFRFEPVEHEYTDLDTGQVYPSITQMLNVTGWIDDRWFTEEHSARGTAVHALTARYDLGALDPETLVSKFKGYLLAHVKAMEIIKPVFREIEIAHVHPRLRFGGRPDRAGVVYGLESVLDGKSGPADKSHAIQTALQAILVAADVGLEPHELGRFCLYWQKTGKFSLVQYKNRTDFDEAYRIIRTCTS